MMHAELTKLYPELHEVIAVNDVHPAAFLGQA